MSVTKSPPGDPKEAGPKPTFPEQKQSYPGSEEAMDPKPDYGEKTYRGSGRLEKRVALITGADSGIGRAVALAYAREGADILFGYLNEDADAKKTEEIVAESGRKAVGVPCDIRSEKVCRELVERTVKEFGRLDVLVNNAAVGMSTVREDHMRRVVQIEDIAPELWAHFMAVNLSGPFYMAHAAVPGMRAQKFGRIINVTTSFFTMLNPGFSPYGPAKSGLEAWSRSLAGELRGTGITVNVVVPGGPTDTPMVPDDGSMERSQLIRPEKMAPPMLHLASDAGGAVTGMRFVAAKWDSSLSVADAIAASGAPAGWPDLAKSPVWPGGGPKR
jgi:NAD(P)-dependent dehydrogenase (short-subunit alcohol dehydrogenase family)